MNRRALVMFGLFVSLVGVAPEARAVEGAAAVTTTITVTVVPEAREEMSYARRVEVHAQGAESLVRETDLEGGRVLASVTRVHDLGGGRALLEGSAVLGAGTRTLQVWLVAVREGRVSLLDELTFTAAHDAPLGGVVRTRGTFRVMIPAPAATRRREVEDWELTVHEAEVDRPRLRFRGLQHDRAGVRAQRPIAWIDVGRDRFVTRVSRRQ